MITLKFYIDGQKKDSFGISRDLQNLITRLNYLLSSIYLGNRRLFVATKTAADRALVILFFFVGEALPGPADGWWSVRSPSPVTAYVMMVSSPS